LSFTLLIRIIKISLNVNILNIDYIGKNLILFDSNATE